MDELAGTENRLATERMRYNDRVQEYNTLRRKFPSNITAKMFGFKEYPYFDAPAEAKAVPKVDFGKGEVGSALPMTLKDSLLPEFDQEMAATRRCSRACRRPRSPGGRTRSRTRSAGSRRTSRRFRIGALRFSSATATTSYDRHGPRGRARHARRRARAVRSPRREVRAALVDTTDAELVAPWALTRGGHLVLSMPKLPRCDAFCSTTPFTTAAN